MKKRLTRSGKVIIAEVYEVINKNGYEYEVVVDKKDFNYFRGMVLNMEPKQKHYNAANAWADNLIYLHVKNTKLS